MILQSRGWANLYDVYQPDKTWVYCSTIEEIIKKWPILLNHPTVKQYFNV